MPRKSKGPSKSQPRQLTANAEKPLEAGRALKETTKRVENTARDLHKMKKDSHCRDFEMDYAFPGVGKRKFLFNDRRLTLGDKLGDVMLLGIKEK